MIHLIGCVNDTMLEQWQCKEWYIQKAGYITASKCKQVYTHQETIEKNIGKDIDVSSLVNNILEPKVPSRKPHISYLKAILFKSHSTKDFFNKFVASLLSFGKQISFHYWFQGCQKKEIKLPLGMSI